MPPAQSPEAFYQFTLTLAAMGFHAGATRALRDLTTRAPQHQGAWRTLAELLRLDGKDDEAAAAAARAPGPAPAASARDPRGIAQLEAGERDLRGRLNTTQPQEQEQLKLLREHLFRNPADAAALRLLATLERQDGDAVTAARLLERALDLAPGYTAARMEYAMLLTARRSYAKALRETTRLMQAAPNDIRHRALHADALRQVGKLPEAIAIIEELLREYPRQAGFHCVYGQALYFAGRPGEAETAYRACLALAPATGEAYWGLAELRTNALRDDDIAAMRTLTESGAAPAVTMPVYYALGHALEKQGDYAASFAAYQAAGNAFRDMAAASGNSWNPATSTKNVQRRQAVFAPATLATLQAPAPAGPAPIFILGMPRAGSTLIEQILASHSLVEPTLELPVMGEITRRLGQSRLMQTPDAYPECIPGLTPADLAGLGASYIEETTAYRTTAKPYFIDKRPWNWLDIGLIHLILPQAKIIDVRREPMAACFAMFKQLLQQEAGFSYDLTDLGYYYKDYAIMMRHYAAVLPGRIHFLQYEHLVENTETEIRALLEYCGLPFEATCLRFWETSRAVATPSAAQVRRPIFREAVEQWRHYAEWLGPLAEALK